MCVHVCCGSHVSLLFAVRVDEPTMHKVSQAEQKYCSIIFGANNTTEAGGGCAEKENKRGWREVRKWGIGTRPGGHMAYISTCIHKSYAAAGECSKPGKQAAQEATRSSNRLLSHCVCVCECPVYVLSYSCAGYFKDIYTDSGFLMEKLL